MLPLGVLLPGQFFSFPFMFKSAKAGIFSEKWLLCTGPLLAGGRPICISLKGTACQEDQHKEQRMKIDVRMYIPFKFHDYIDHYVDEVEQQAGNKNSSTGSAAVGEQHPNTSYYSTPHDTIHIGMSSVNFCNVTILSAI